MADELQAVVKLDGCQPTAADNCLDGRGSVNRTIKSRFRFGSRAIQPQINK